MKRILITTATLALLTVSTAGALALEKKDDVEQLKPPVEQRIDSTTSGLHDSLMIGRPTDSIVDAPQDGAPENASALRGTWRAPSQELPE